MTIPVSSYMTKTPEGEMTQEMSFFIGAEHQQNVPEPTDKDVYITERPRMVIITR